MDALTFLTYLSVILLLGIICTVLSQKLNVPNILLLLLAGLFAGRIPYGEGHLFEFPGVFLTSISILTLVMIIFDSASRFKLKQFGDLSIQALKLSVIFLFFNLFLLTSTVVIIFKIDSILTLFTKNYIYYNINLNIKLLFFMYIYIYIYSLHDYCYVMLYIYIYIYMYVYMMYIHLSFYKYMYI